MIPKNISNALTYQSLPVLYEIKDLIEGLISDRENAGKPSISSKREVLEVKRSGSMTYRLERVSCGKGCKGCPHGPYWYGYWKEDGKTRSKYIGKRLAAP
jgi:hypothetical protein